VSDYVSDVEEASPGDDDDDRVGLNKDQTNCKHFLANYAAWGSNPSQ
jgi:hypothetical protein